MMQTIDSTQSAVYAPEGGMGVNAALKILRKRACLLLCACLMISMLPAAFAQEAQAKDSGLSFTLSVSPESLVAPGAVTVSARVSNASQEDIVTPLKLVDPDGKLVTSFGDGGTLLRLPSGESQPWQGQYAVKQEQLDAGKLTYSLKYSLPDAQGNLIEQTLPASANLTFTGEKVDLKVTRTITPEVVRRNGNVSVIYELVNQGNVKLNNLRLKENSLISGQVKTITTLAPGDSEKVTFQKANVTGELTSSLLITYRKEGDRVDQRMTIEQQAIPLAAPNLIYTLTSDKTQVNLGETITLTLDIKNNGNINYSNITVTDPKLGEVFANQQIAAGETKSLTREVILNETTTFNFVLKLEDNTGTTKEEKVPALKVSAYSEGQMLRLNLTLTADNENISSIPGDIRFHLTVTNDSNTSAKDIRVMHASNEIYVINELAPGQSTVVTRDYRLSQAGKYQFSAIATDVQNNPVTFTSNALNIGYVPPTPAPTRKIVETVPPVVTLSPVPDDFGTQNGQGRNALFIATLAMGVLFGLAAILLITSTVMRANARKKSDSAFDTFEVSGTRDYTAPPASRPEAQPVDADSLEEDQELPIDRKEKADMEMPHEKYLKKDAPTLEAETALEEGKEALKEAKAETEPVQEEMAEAVEGYRLVRGEEKVVVPPKTEETEAAEGGESRTRRARRHQSEEKEDKKG